MGRELLRRFERLPGRFRWERQRRYLELALRLAKAKRGNVVLGLSGEGEGDRVKQYMVIPQGVRWREEGRSLGWGKVHTFVNHLSEGLPGLPRLRVDRSAYLVDKLARYRSFLTNFLSGRNWVCCCVSSVNFGCHCRPRDSSAAKDRYVSELREFALHLARRDIMTTDALKRDSSSRQPFQLQRIGAGTSDEARARGGM